MPQMIEGLLGSYWALLFSLSEISSAVAIRFTALL
jgi:hypothetical protein